jgi:hypothetical protein
MKVSAVWSTDSKARFACNKAYMKLIAHMSVLPGTEVDAPLPSQLRNMYRIAYSFDYGW